MNSIERKISFVKEEFPFLKTLLKYGCFDLEYGSDYAEVIIQACIPYKPGIYFVYSLGKDNKPSKLLYYGKAGVTSYKGEKKLNFHQLPKRLLATVKLPANHEFFTKTKPRKYSKVKKDTTRAKLWPWYVKNQYRNGLRIFWFLAEWPHQDPNQFEKLAKNYLQIKNWTTLIK